MNTTRTQEALRKLKIQLLQWRIDHTLNRLERCQANTALSRNLAVRLMVLVHERNALRTAAELAEIEHSRGLA